MVKCEICGKEFKILQSHLISKHKINKEEYMNKYPNSKLVDDNWKEKFKGANNPFYGKIHSDKTKNHLSNCSKEQFKNGMSEETKNKISNSVKSSNKYISKINSSEYKEKVSNGVKNSYKKNKEEILKKRKDTRLKNGTEENFGMKNVKNQNKAKETIKNKYGVDSVGKIPGAYLKSHSTKKKNGSYKKSNQEEDVYKLLLEKYNEDDIVRQYFEKRYQFACDFYIKSLDLFIECNFNWTHGYERFNQNNEKHIEKLNKWKSKENDHIYYKRAIKTWTERDVEKYNVSKINNLNYLIFYKYNDFLSWIKHI